MGTGSAASSSPSDDSNALLRARLAVLAKTMFWLYAIVAVATLIAFTLVPELRPGGYVLAQVIGGAAALVLAAVWVVTTRSWRLSAAALRNLDVAIVAAMGLMLAIVAYVTGDRPQNGHLTLAMNGFFVIGRALIVPSTTRRTLALSVVGMTPVVTAYVAIAMNFPAMLTMPPWAWVTSTAVAAGIAVLLATIGAAVIYGLRREVKAARRLGQYILGEKIGEGGMGTVYLASHALLRRPTAIKLLRANGKSPASLRRFEHEVQVTSELTHPNTVAVYDYGHTPDGTFYYAMEYLEGVDLARLVRKFGPQPAERVVHIMLQVCGALQEAHQRSLIHRDIKPANIVLCNRGGVADYVKVLDFGLAKQLSSNESVTQEGALAGTPAYIAPEAFTSPEEVGPRSDLYALGAVTYLLLTGERPFEGATVVELCAHHLTTTPIPPSERTDNPVSPELERLVLRCLAKKPSERPASAEQLAEEMAATPEAGRWTPARAAAWWGDSETVSALASRTDMRSQVHTMTIDVVARGKA